MFYVVKKHISVIINKAPYPEKPLLSVEAVWEERHLVSDLEVAAGAFSILFKITSGNKEVIFITKEILHLVMF